MIVRCCSLDHTDPAALPPGRRLSVSVSPRTEATLQAISAHFGMTFWGEAAEYVLAEVGLHFPRWPEIARRPHFLIRRPAPGQGMARIFVPLNPYADAAVRRMARSRRVSRSDAAAWLLHDLAETILAAVLADAEAEAVQ